MSYKIDHTAPLVDEVSRIGLQQIDRVTRSLGGHKDPDTDIHEARKGLKRLRSVLRLIRPALADDVYRAENARLRDIGRALAGLRDQHVIATKVAYLRQTPDGSTPAAHRALAALGRQTVSPAGEQHEETREIIVARASVDLGEARRFWGHPLPARSSKDGTAHAGLLAGVAKTYASIRTALADARDSGCDERYHDARKATQHHARHMTLLSNAWPDYFTARSRAARALALILGEHHDFAVLRAVSTLSDHGETLTRPQSAVIDRLCRGEQTRLIAEAEPIAARLLAASPRALVKEIAAALASCRMAEDTAG